jgi:hypothetical protein
MGKKTGRQKGPKKTKHDYLLTDNSIAMMPHKTPHIATTVLPPPTPFIAYQQARRYNLAAINLWFLAQNQHPDFMFPAVTLESFSCELFLTPFPSLSTLQSRPPS